MKTFLIVVSTFLITSVTILVGAFSFVSTAQYHEWRKEWQVEVIDRAKNFSFSSIADSFSFEDEVETNKTDKIVDDDK